MSFPWISRGHHEDVLRVKQDLIDHLKAQIAVLEQRLLQPVTVNATVTLPEDFAVIYPATVRGSRRKQQDPGEPALAPVNWEEVDENNLPKIAEIAARELPPGANAYLVQQTVSRIRTNIRLAKLAKGTRTLTTGAVGTSTPPAAAAVAVEESPIPDHIRRRIEDAERGE